MTKRYSLHPTPKNARRVAAGGQICAHFGSRAGRVLTLSAAITDR